MLCLLVYDSIYGVEMIWLLFCYGKGLFVDVILMEMLVFVVFGYVEMLVVLVIGFVEVSILLFLCMEVDGLFF